MLRTIGVESIDDLFRQVPPALRARATLDLRAGLSEPELRQELERLAARNDGASVTAFLGAGAYPHWVPSVVDQVLLRSEFATAYTPYQAEVSQGTLQAIFEFQTFSAILLGMEVANASMYDGASACAEAVLMARRVVGARRRVWVARALHPHYRAAIATYLRGLSDVEIGDIPFDRDGRTDLEALGRVLGADALCVVLGYPNVFGVVEDVTAAAALARNAGAFTITATTEPLALAMIRSPGGAGADVAVAEGQSFGIPVSYGGPGVGLFAARARHVRSMPGRIVGETRDARGSRGYVLTLATREQHIRRERATSNICTNQGLCALAVTVYLSLLGRNGLRNLAEANFRAAHAAAGVLRQAGCPRRFGGEFFNEFVVTAPGMGSRWEALARDGLVAGFPLERWYPELKDALLICVTEVHTPRQLDRLAAALTGAGAEARPVRD
jgi:glycine dehydrogenase subunit 1